MQLDPEADEAFEMDWGREHLPASVGIATSTWEITGKAGAAALEQHDDGIGDYDDDDLWEATAGGQVARVFLTGSTGIALGQRYTITNHIVTNSSPPETKDRSFDVLIQSE